MGRFQKKSDKNNLKIKPDFIFHFAAQAGVRYSLDVPRKYISSNIIGTFNIIEIAHKIKVKHLLIASSSSVYGVNKQSAFKETDKTDTQLSIYAATKKCNELMAHSYSHLFNIRTTGIRFFTVYGEWGRPDMAYYLFAEAISNDQPIKVFNNGEMERDFTYIDDIVNGVTKIIEKNIADIYVNGKVNSQSIGNKLDEIDESKPLLVDLNAENLNKFVLQA